MSVQHKPSVESIWYATINGVPDELKEQADDFENVANACKRYAAKYGVRPYKVIDDLQLTLIE